MVRFLSLLKDATMRTYRVDVDNVQRSEFVNSYVVYRVIIILITYLVAQSYSQ